MVMPHVLQPSTLVIWNPVLFASLSAATQVLLLQCSGGDEPEHDAVPLQKQGGVLEMDVDVLVHYAQVY